MELLFPEAAIRPHQDGSLETGTGLPAGLGFLDNKVMSPPPSDRELDEGSIQTSSTRAGRAHFPLSLWTPEAL